jgi:hypothetical protein
MERNNALHAVESATLDHRLVYAGSQEQLGYSPDHKQVCSCDNRHMSQEEALAHITVAIVENLQKQGLKITDADGNEVTLTGGISSAELQRRMKRGPRHRKSA